MSTHRIIRIALAGLALASAASLAPLAATPASAGGGPYSAPVLMRASTDGRGGQLTLGAADPVLSSDGRYLAFVDRTDKNAYLEDTLSGQTTLVSTTSSGQLANGWSDPVDVSADGKLVLFTSQATNLAAAPHAFTDLYLRNVATKTTTRLDYDTKNQLTGVYSAEASMDDYGQIVTWESQDTKVWARRLKVPVSTQRVDVSSAEVGGNKGGSAPTVNAQGDRVVFTSWSTNLVGGDTNNTGDIFERNLTNGTTTRVSMAAGNAEGHGPSDHASVSKDGRFVAFESYAALVPNDTASSTDIYVRDTVAGTTVRASLGPNGVQANDRSSLPTITDDGKLVAFLSDAGNLATTDKSVRSNVFIRNLAAATTTQLDRSVTGAAANDGTLSAPPALSKDGAVYAFGSGATNLVAGDTNGNLDVFVRVTTPLGPHPTFTDFAKTVIPRFHAPTATTAGRIADLTNGRVTVGHFLVTLADDDEWSGDLAPVDRLYTAFFNREPDLGGLKYWAGRHAKGTRLSAIASNFAASSEFQTKYGHVDNSSFVKLVYQNVLGRPADSAGLAHWKAKLAGGTTRGDLMVQFSESSEGRRHMAPQVETVLIGLGMLGRLPTAVEFNGGINTYPWEGIDGIALMFLEGPAYHQSL